MGRSSQRIGDEAERVFDGWANRAAFEVEAPVKDRLGIDRVIEIAPRGVAEGVGLDHRTPAIRALVQVKGTRSVKPPSRSIKLDVLERFAKSPLPCFFLFVQLGDEFDVRGAYLVPMDEELIARTLARVRGAASGAFLHKLKMKVGCMQPQRLSSPLHGAFVDAVREHVGDVASYPDRKRAWSQSVGYGEHPFTFTFRGRPADMEAFVRGQAESAEVELVKVQETRFDITRAPPSGPKPGRVKIVQMSSRRLPASIQLSCGDEHVFLRGDVEGSGPFERMLPEMEPFVRFYYSSLVITLTGHPVSTLSVEHLAIRDFDHEDTVDGFGDGARAFRLLLTEGSKLKINVNGPALEADLGATSIEPALSQQVLLFEVLRDVAREAGVPTDTRVSAARALDRRSAERLLEWSLVLPEPRDVSYVCELAGYKGEPLLLVRPVWLAFGDLVASRVVTLVDPAPEVRRDGRVVIRPRADTATPPDVRPLTSLGNGTFLRDQTSRALAEVEASYPDGAHVRNSQRLSEWSKLCDGVES